MSTPFLSNKIRSLSSDGKDREKKENANDDEMIASGDQENDNSDRTDESQLIQRCVIIHRDERGYGFTVSGDNPVFVQLIKENGAADRAGVRQGDRIVKVNGTLVTSCNHTDVVKLIKSGSYVALKLLGRSPIRPTLPLDTLERSVAATATAAATASKTLTPTSTPTFVERGIISSPQAVDHDKDLLFKAQKLNTIQMMHKQVQEDYEKMRQEFQKNPSETLQNKLQLKLQMLRRLEDQLKATESVQPLVSPQSDVQSPSSESSGLPPLKRLASISASSGGNRQDVTNDGKESSHPSSHSSMISSFLRGPTPWMPTGPKHRKTDSLPETLYKIDEDNKEVQRHSTGKNFKSNEEDVLRNEDIDIDLKTPVPDSARHSCGLVPSTDTGLLSPTQLSNNNSDAETSLDPTAQQPNAIGSKSTLCKSSLKVISPNQVKVITMEDSDFSTVDDPGIFIDLQQLKHRPAHMAVFLHYLVSNSDPAAMLFYLVSETYPLGSLKEMRKWAYEIFSTFLCDKAPLKINVDESVVSMINATLVSKFDKEDAMKNVFQTARIFAQNEINDLLTDFRSKRALGLGSIYGDQQLKDNMDRQSELRIIDNTLWKHFERLLSNEDCDRSQAMASSLATFFKQVGYTNQKNNSSLERCTSFNAKDKKTFNFRKPNNKKILHANGHQFAAQHYFTTTYCGHCGTIIWGVGNQGYQCASCDVNLHKNCLDQYKESCSGSNTLRKKKDRRPPSMFDIISRKLSNNSPSAIKEAQHQHQHQHQHLSVAESNLVSPLSSNLSEADEFDQLHNSVSSALAEMEKSPDEQKNCANVISRDQSPDYYEDDSVPNTSGVGLGRSESLNHRSELRASVKRTHSDVSSTENPSVVQPPNTSGSSSSSSLSKTSDSSEGLHDVTSASSSQKSQFNDSDFDVLAELPLLESIIPKELFRKLKPKEKKRQEVINELFYTERTHVRNLKVLNRIFYQPMLEESFISDHLVSILFPNLAEVIDTHCALNNDLKAKKTESPVVGDFADILVKRFSGEEGEKFKMAAAKFCQQQSHALEMLRDRLRKDQKLVTFLQEAASNQLCRRLELKDLILTEMQRLTKYPLLIENLLKYTLSNTDEYDQLLKAHDMSKEVLNYVNQRVEESENHQKLVEFQKKLDRKPMENSSHPVVAEFKKLDLTRHRMIYDGSLTWRVSRSKMIDLHVLLLDDILVLMQKQDEKYVLRCQSSNREAATKDDMKSTHSPIIKINNLLTRNVATDKRAFFLVSMSDMFGPQIYEFVANTKEEKNKWFKYITEAAEAYKAKDKEKNKKPETLNETISDDKQEKLSKADVDDHHQDGTDTEADEKRGSAESLENVGRFEVLSIEPSQLVQPNEVKVSHTEVMEKLEPSKTSLDLLKEKNRLIETTMFEKKRLLADLLHISIENYDHIAEIAGEVEESTNVKELLLGSLVQADELTNLISEGLDESFMAASSMMTTQTKDANLRLSGDDDDDATPMPSPGMAACSSGKQPLPPHHHHPSPAAATSLRSSGSTAATIVLSSSRLVSIASHLQRHLSQLMDAMVAKDIDSKRSSSQPLCKTLSYLPSSRVTEETEELREEPSCVKLSAPLVTFPVVVEHVEVIEAETILTEPSVVRTTTTTTSRPRSYDNDDFVANVSVVYVEEKTNEPSNERETT